MNRLEWVLGIILVILLVAAAGLAVMLWIRPATTTGENSVIASYADDVAPLPDTTGHTAKAAYLLAQAKSQAWQPDAVLVSSTATWPQGAQPDYLKQGKADWAFTFHSPATTSNITVAVHNGETTVIPGESQKPVTLLESSSWQLDSSDAINTLFTEGGKTFIEKEGVTILKMTLVTNDPYDNGRLEWLVSIIGTQSGNAYNMRIDAASGEVLNILDTSS